jgi:shikimate kinase
MAECLFIIGPGGVGKTTVGPLVARRLDRPFVDLDQVFHTTIGNIGAFIPRQGYRRYVEENAALFERLIAERTPPFVMALSSGFLASDGADIATRNRGRVAALGLRVLLLPHEEIDTATKIVVARQLGRGFGLKEENERDKFRKRFAEYQRLADVTVFSAAAPEEIAATICARLACRGVV